MGEFFALILFGTVGMLLMTSAVELLLVFIGLEISSISTYILAGFRKRTGRSPEAAIKYFLLGSFATAFFLYGIALTFGATGTTRIAAIAAALPHTTTPILAWTAVASSSSDLASKFPPRPSTCGRRMSMRARPRLSLPLCPPRRRPQPSRFCCASSTAHIPPSSSTGGASSGFSPPSP